MESKTDVYNSTCICVLKHTFSFDSSLCLCFSCFIPFFLSNFLSSESLQMHFAMEFFFILMCTNIFYPIQNVTNEFKWAKKKIYVKAYTYGHTIHGKYDTAVAFNAMVDGLMYIFFFSPSPNSMRVGKEYNARMKGVLKCIVNIMLTNGSYSSIHFHSRKKFISGHRSVEQCTWQHKQTHNEYNEQVPRPFRFLHILDKLINVFEEYTK